jgi:branched-chain amino acid transport system substrate-binding protein
MRSAKNLTAIALLGIGLGATATQAADPYDINVIVPLTGGGSFAGKGQQVNLDALAAVVNKDGGIDGRPVHFVYSDDQTSPQIAVQLANQVLANHPPVILGSSLVAMCNAIAPLTAAGPVMYCLSPGIHPPAGSYDYSVADNSYDLVATVLRYFRLKGWTKIAVMSSTDASGQDFDKGLTTELAKPENTTLQKVEHQHFNTSDMSVTAQLETIKSAQPQALIAWTTGAAIATIFRGILQTGLDIPVATTNGNQTLAQMEQYAPFMPKQLLIPSALFPPHDGLFELDPRVEKVQHEMYDVLKERGITPDNMTSTSWDAGLIVVSALRKLGPNATAEQIRDYINGLTDFPGVNGMYDFGKYPQRGLGADGAVMVRYAQEKTNWIWLSKPGGTPLSP